jgi:WXG100 family type VII secretion target
MATGMTSIQVTPDNLRTQAAKVDQLATEYNDQYTTLLNEVDGFTSTDWKGSDATAFRDQVQGFKDDFVKMKELMNDYARFMRDSAQLYEDTQKDIINQAKGLQN